MTPVSQGRSGRFGSPLAWSVWAGMLAVALLAIARYGPEIPRAEDWLLVPALTGHAPSIGAWLWAQNSEHRVPLPQLAYLALLKATGGDFRAAMVFDTLALAGLAAAMMLAARRLRGSTSVVDALFPVTFLHLGHWDNLIWSWQIQFVASTLLAGAFVLIVVTWSDTLTPPRAALTALCLVALPLCGANGLALVPVFALWAIYTAARVWRTSPDSTARTTAVLLAGGAAVAAALVAVYFIGYERATWYPDSPGRSVTARIAAQFLAMAFGPGVAVSWRVLVLVTLAVVTATLVLLILRLRDSGAQSRQRIVGLLCIVCAMLVLAVALAWGRGGRVATSGLSRRYALLAVPLLCAVFFAWQLYAPRRWATRVQVALLLVAVALLPANTRAGLAARDWVEQGMDAVRHDIAAGMPRPLLAERHRPFLLHWDGERLAAGMRMLGDAGIRPFAGLPDDFGVEEISVADAPDGIVRLPRSQHVYAVRLSVAPDAGSPSATGVRLTWRGTDGRARRESVPPAAPGEAGDSFATLWINDVVDRFTVEADEPPRLRGLRLLLLSRPRAERHAPRPPAASAPESSAQAPAASPAARTDG
jgi:hypothetical protein